MQEKQSNIKQRVNLELNKTRQLLKSQEKNRVQN